MARVVVTGGAGFLGSHLVEELLARSHAVVAVDDLFRGKQKHLNDCKGSPDFHFLKGDCADLAVLRKAAELIDGVDVIYHLAAVNGTRWFHERADMVIDVNVNTTIAALALAEENTCRLVFASSPEALGVVDEQPMGVSMDSRFEDAALHQRHSYGASKYIGEVLIQHAVRTKDMDCRIVRPFNAYGGRCPSNEYGQVISIFMDAAVTGRPIKVHGDGSQTRSFCFVDDLIDGMISFMNVDAELTGPMNMGKPGEYSMTELAEAIIDLTNSKSELVYQELPQNDPKQRQPNIDMAKKHLGWSPKTDLHNGLKKTIGYFEKLVVSAR